MNTRSMPLVSIVTPVYNGAEYLAECIESVLSQSYQNWDYVILNNCSTDGSGEIARGYAARDSRIRVIENDQFLRVIPNHNRSLRQISPDSKYCKMVFADDWMFPECLERMVAVAEENPSIGIVGAYGLQGKKVVWTGLPYPSRLVSGREVCRKRFLEGQYVFGTATALLVRSDLVRANDPFYNESNLHADSEVCFALLRDCDFGFVHQILTFTRERDGSLRSFTQDMNTMLAGVLHEIVTYGNDYLERDEFQVCLNRHMTEYYRFLAVSLLRGGRNREFWAYHKRKLKDAGVGFDYVRLTKATLAAVTDGVLNPKQTAEELVKLVRSGGHTRFLRKFIPRQKAAKQSKHASLQIQAKEIR